MASPDYNSTGDAGAYCVPEGQIFQQAYIKIHGFLALTVCLLGSTANVVNVVVLSRKEMSTSTNSILTGLAVADLFVMLDYIPFALHTYTRINTDLNRNSYGWAVFVYFHSIFSQIFHTISIWLTITLAVWRYIAITYPQKNKVLCSKRNTNVAITLAYIVCPILCVPIYFAMDIHEKIHNTNDILIDKNFLNRTFDTQIIYALTMTSSEGLLTAIFWIYSVFMKLIPCVVLSVLSVSLISKMKSIVKKRKMLSKKTGFIGNKDEKIHLHEENNSSGVKMQREEHTDRSTRMLLALLGLFLATELPQAFFGLLTAIAPHLFQICYYAFGEVMDLMALVGSAVNFVLYCSMSQQYRSTFVRLLRKVFMLS